MHPHINDNHITGQQNQPHQQTMLEPSKADSFRAGGGGGGGADSGAPVAQVCTIQSAQTDVSPYSLSLPWYR